MVKLTRSAIISTKIINKNKREKLTSLYNKGKELTKKYLNIIWKLETGKYAGKDLYIKVESTMTARFKQLCCMKALAMKRSITAKIKKKQYIIDKLKKENIKFKKNKKKKEIRAKNKLNIKNLQKIIKTLNKKPTLNDFSLDLNANFIKIDENATTAKKYKNWITVSSSGKTFNTNLPFIKTKPFNKWKEKGKLSQFISVDKDNLIKVVFTLETPKKKKNGLIIGCDIGLNNVYSFSNKITSSPNNHGYDLPYIHRKICKTKPNSVNCKQTLEHRDNYIRNSINLIDFSKIKTLVVEDISYLRYKKKGISRYLSSWRYALIFSKLESRCEEEGVEIIKVNPCNTSRRCYKCGWVSINNRNVKVAKKFKCCKCKHSADADVNAAKNIKYIRNKKEIKSNTKSGFYFNLDL